MTEIAAKEWAALAKDLIKEIDGLTKVKPTEKERLNKLRGRLENAQSCSAESREGALLALQENEGEHAVLLEGCKSREENHVALLSVLSLFNRVMNGVPVMLKLMKEESETHRGESEVPSTSNQVLSS